MDKQGSWEGFIEASTERFRSLWGSSCQSMNRRHFRRAFRYIITGSAEASKAEARIVFYGALLTSPEMIAVVISLMVAIGTVILMLLRIPFALVDSSDTKKYVFPISVLYNILHSNDSGLQSILTSLFLFVLVAFLGSAVSRKASEEVARAKAGLAGNHHASSFYYWLIGNEDTLWYKVAETRTLNLFSVIIRFVGSPFMLIVYAILVAMYFSEPRLSLTPSEVGGGRGSQPITPIAVNDFLYLCTLILISIAWVLCWGKTPYPSGESDEKCSKTHRLTIKIRKLLADLPGLLIGPVVLCVSSLSILVKYRMSDQAASNSVWNHMPLINVLVLILVFECYCMITLLLYGKTVIRVIRFLVLRERYRRTHNVDRTQRWYECHSFSAWVKISLWRFLYSTVMRTLLVEFALLLLCSTAVV